MKHVKSYLVIGATVALAAGCSLPGSPDYGTTEGAMVALDADEVSPTLRACTCQFGTRANWPMPDAIYAVADQPGVVILVREGEQLCRTSLALLRDEIPSDPLQALRPSGGGEASDSGPADDSNPLPADAVDGVNTGDDEASDSNPLPAKGGGTVTATDQRSDSNPLPARDGGGGSVSMTNPLDDSNPLPADNDSQVDFSEQQLEGLSSLI